MLWRASPKPLTIPPSAPVPDAEALRQAALQASWRRDHRVARRRVWLRWALWVSGRYVMPALLVFGLGAWLWLGVWPGMGNALDSQTVFKTPVTSPVAITVPVPNPAPAPATLPPEPEAATFSPEGEELPVPLHLRFELRWAASAGSTSITSGLAPEPDTITPVHPHLKPENWLHSKEP